LLAQELGAKVMPSRLAYSHLHPNLVVRAPEPESELQHRHQSAQRTCIRSCSDEPSRLGQGAEDVVDIVNVSSGSEAAIGAGVAKSLLGGGEIGVTLRWAGLGLGLGLLASDVVEVSVVTGYGRKVYVEERCVDCFVSVFAV